MAMSMATPWQSVPALGPPAGPGVGSSRVSFLTAVVSDERGRGRRRDPVAVVVTLAHKDERFRARIPAVELEFRHSGHVTEVESEITQCDYTFRNSNG